MKTMNINRDALLCLGYVLGLFLTCLWGGINPTPDLAQWLLLLGAIAILTTLAIFILPRYFWQLQKTFWISFGLIALCAAIYFQVRIPRPATGDIFHLAQAQNALLKYPIEIVGNVTKELPLKGDNQQRFWLQVDQVHTKFENYKSKGSLYVTLPINPSVKLVESGDKINLKGKLYQPEISVNNSDFNFANYLRKNNTFLGFKAWESTIYDHKISFFRKIRQRIINSYQIFLPEDRANLLGSMVLDRRAVNLDPKIYAHWVKAGLAHTVAASGFHVSLLLGFVTWLLQRKEVKYQFIFGVSILLFYVFLTGGQPSILRAVLMGIGSLTALLLGRKTKPLSLLLLSGTLLLIYQPLWIWDLGFQLSFLATFGLLTTLKPIEKYLEFLPPNLATTIAIPLAASLWTLPLLAYQFNVIATYSLPLNILFALPITLVSLGGMIAAALGLIFPVLGGAIAYLVGYPLMLMMATVDYVITLPLSHVSIASLHWSQLATIYSVMLFIWLTKFGKRHSKSLGLGLCVIFILCLVFKQFSTVKLTVLNTDQEPVLIAQAGGKALVFTGELDTKNQYGLIPFLRESGINDIHVLMTYEKEVSPKTEQSNSQNLDQQAAEKIVENPSVNSSIIDALDAEFTIREELRFIFSEAKQTPLPLKPFTFKKIGQIRVQLLQENPFLLELKLENQSFYILGDRQPTDPALMTLGKGYLITNPHNIDLALWQTLKPQGAIAIGSSKNHFLAPNRIVHWTEEEGNLQWTPHDGLAPALQETP